MQNQFKGTQDKWCLNSANKKEVNSYNGIAIADCSMSVMIDNEEKEANAKLISIAPELLLQSVRISEWNKKYPSSKIFSQSEIIKISKELDEIVEDGQKLIDFVNGGGS